MRIGLLTFLAVLSHADTITAQLSAGPGTTLSATETVGYIEVSSSNLPPPETGWNNYGIVDILAGFEDWAWNAPCVPIDPSMPARCTGGINDEVELGGIDVSGPYSGAVIQFDVGFSNCAGCDDFDGYFIGCTTYSNGSGTLPGFSNFPGGTCVLAPGTYDLVRRSVIAAGANRFHRSFSHRKKPPRKR